MATAGGSHSVEDIADLLHATERAEAVSGDPLRGWADLRPCGRYFSSGVATDLGLKWPSSNELVVTVPEGGLQWSCNMASTGISRAFNALGSVMPRRAWRSRRLLGVMGRPSTTPLADLLG